MSILWIRKWRLREVKELAPGLPAGGCKLEFETGCAGIHNCTAYCVRAVASCAAPWVAPWARPQLPPPPGAGG